MTKSIKKITAVFCAALLTFAALCTGAFAAGTIDEEISGDVGNKKITYSYSVNSTPTASYTAIMTTTTANSYSLRFSPASESSATIYFYDWYTHKLLDILNVPMSGGGMPSSFITSVDLGINTVVYVKIKSNSSTNASGWFTIEGVLSECYLD